MSITSGLSSYFDRKYNEFGNDFYFTINGKLINPYAPIEETEIAKYEEEDRVVKAKLKMNGG